MKETDIAWLAGLLEGEGCFSIIHRPGRKSEIRIQVHMTDKDILDRVSLLMETNTSPPQKLRPGQKCIQYRSLVSAHKAYRIMGLILPYMGERRSKRIKECMLLWRRTFEGSYDPKIYIDARKISTANDLTQLGLS